MHEHGWLRTQSSSALHDNDHVDSRSSVRPSRAAKSSFGFDCLQPKMRQFSILPKYRREHACLMDGRHDSMRCKMTQVHRSISLLHLITCDPSIHETGPITYASRPGRQQFHVLQVACNRTWQGVCTGLMQINESYYDVIGVIMPAHEDHCSC